MGRKFLVFVFAVFALWPGFAPGAVAGAAVTREFAVSFLRQVTLPGEPGTHLHDVDHRHELRGIRASGLISVQPISVWGFAERLMDFRGTQGSYGELAASVHHSSWFATIAGGLGSANLWRPQWMQHLTLGRAFVDAPVSMGLGVTRVHYDIEPGTGHQFHSATFTVRPSARVTVSMVAQVIRQSSTEDATGETFNDDPGRLREGRGIAIAGNWATDGDLVGLSALHTCMGRWPCAGSPQDRYQEIFLDLRHSLANGYGVSSRLGFTSSPRAAQIWLGGYQSW